MKQLMLVAALVVFPSAAGSLLTSGCASPAPVPTATIDMNISDAELAPFQETGSSSISGQALLRQQGGGAQASCI